MKKLSIIVGLFSVLSIFMMSCGGGTTTSQEKINIQTRIESEHAVDSLYSYLLQNINMQEGMEIKVTEFSPKACTMQITVPEEIGASGADVVGTGICVLATKWLAAKKYDISLGNIFVRCSVISPYVGITAQPDMFTHWGRAVYDPNIDNVKWTWSKAK